MENPFIWLMRADGRMFIIRLEDLLSVEYHPRFTGWILDKEPIE